MPSKAELVCFDPARVQEIWPHASPLIRRAAERTGLSRFEDIEADVLKGHGLLWLAWNGQAIEAAATTILTSEKVCILTACSGEDRGRWLPLLEQIEAYAKAEGCTRVRIYGRKGWARVLDGYHVEHVILEKGL